MKRLLLGLLLLFSISSCTTEENWNGPIESTNCLIVDYKQETTIPGRYEYYIICTGNGRNPAFEVSKFEYDKHTFSGGSQMYAGGSVINKITISGKYYLICSGYGQTHIFKVNHHNGIVSGNEEYNHYGDWLKITNKIIVTVKQPSTEYYFTLNNNVMEVSKKEYDMYNEGSTYCLNK